METADFCFGDFPPNKRRQRMLREKHMMRDRQVQSKKETRPYLTRPYPTRPRRDETNVCPETLGSMRCAPKAASAKGHGRFRGFAILRGILLRRIPLPSSERWFTAQGFTSRV